MIFIHSIIIVNSDDIRNLGGIGGAKLTNYYIIHTV